MLPHRKKEHLSLPPLSSVEESQLPQRQKLTALKTLKYLKPEELQLEDDDSGSELSDLFPEPENMDIAKGFTKVGKRLSRMEQNIELMKSFSEDYKKAIEEVRREMELESRIYYEDIDQINETLKQASLSKNLSKSKAEQLNEILKNDEDFISGSDLVIPELKPRKNPSKTGKEYDEMSGVWKMLATNESIIATPPYYNAYKQEKSHWLDMPAPNWKTIDEAREKCANWLDKIKEPINESKNVKKKK